MQKFYSYVFLVLLVLIFVLAGLWYFILNDSNNYSFNNNFLSPFDFINVDTDISLYDNESKSVDDTDTDKIIDKYALFYSISNNINYIPTAFLYKIGEDKNIPIINPDKTSIYITSLDKNNLLCISISEKDIKNSKQLGMPYKYSLTKLKSFENIYCDIENAKLIPIDDIKFINSISLRDNKILISVLKKTKHKLANIHAKNWDIYLVDLFSNSYNKLTNGTYPNWVSDKEFIYLSKNGLELFSLENNKSKTIYKFNNPGIDSFLSYANKGDVVIWSFPNKNKVYILRLVKIDGKYIGARKITELDKVMIKPRVSDDGRFIVYISSDPVKYYSNKADKGYVFVYDIKSKKDIRQLGNEFNKNEVYTLLFYNFMVWNF